MQLNELQEQLTLNKPFESPGVNAQMIDFIAQNQTRIQENNGWLKQMIQKEFKVIQEMEAIWHS